MDFEAFQRKARIVQVKQVRENILCCISKVTGRVRFA